MGLILGIILIWVNFDHHLDYETVFAHAGEHQAIVPVICLLLFCGAVGKSAQFPLHVWLPDAMEGPSPVSALIHAATMVTAGVYLVARSTPLFALAPGAQLTVAVIGAGTALLAALIALTQTDLKRVLAYSTISQLGYMFLALGSGVTESLLTAAVVAAMFHLFTHAIFKALLFLAAGSVMHAMGDVIDMRRFGGLRRVLPITHATFLCGALALAGIPPLSGFWSKDEILGVVSGAAHVGVFRPAIYLLLLGAAILTAGLTAFYTFRAYFLTFWGTERVPEEAGHHAHESPPVMTVPLIVLAFLAVGAGLLVGPLSHAFSGIITRTPFLKAELEHPAETFLVMGTTAIAFLGVAMAWWFYVVRPELAPWMAGRLRGFYNLSLYRFHVDDLYTVAIVMPLSAVAGISSTIDFYVIDGLVDCFGQVPRLIGQMFRPIQNGLVQFYALAMVLGLTVFLLALLSR